MRHVQSTLGWSLIGFLVTSVLINVIGFISPLWGQWMHPDDLYASLDLLHLWQPITPWFSVCFVIAAWHLAMTTRASAARVCVIAMGALVPVAYVGSSFARRAMAQADSPVPPQLPAAISVFATAYLWLAALVFLALVWRAVREANNSLEPSTLQGSPASGSSGNSAASAATRGGSA